MVSPPSSVAELVTGLARATRAQAVFLPAPGVLSSGAVAAALMADPSISHVMKLWDALTVSLVGIGDVEPSLLIRQSGNVVSDRALEELRAVGAVGDVCLRFYDADGEPVKSDFNDRVVGISADQYLNIPRRIGVAGGKRKFTAILAALRGEWVNTLITDVGTAKRLVSAADSGGQAR